MCGEREVGSGVPLHGQTLQQDHKLPHAVQWDHQEYARRGGNQVNN